MTFHLRQSVAVLQQDLSALLIETAALLGNAKRTPEYRVHEARKRLKRARAWALLLDLDIDAQLRAVHRALARHRDRDALADALKRLQPAAPKAVRPVLQRLLAALPAAEVRIGRQAARELRALASALPENNAGFRMLARGVADTARRSRRGLRRALASGDPHDFHRWRKWMKYHALQLRYLVPLQPDLLAVQADIAATVAQWLGDGHDIELVRGFAAKMPLAAGEAGALQAFLDAQQQLLHAQAAAVGRLLHAESPRQLEKRLRGYRRDVAGRAGRPGLGEASRRE